jgi:hypothetical protein
MIKALYNFLKCNIDTEPPPKYSFTYDKYNNEREVHMEIKNVDVNVGVNGYTSKKIISACETAMPKDNKILHFLKYFLDKFFSKNNVKESIIYIEIDGKLIRIRNIMSSNQSVIKLSIDK